MPSPLANKLRQARLAEGISQADLARKLEVAQPTISTWETGAIVPGPAQLSKLEEIFGRLTSASDSNDQLESRVAPLSNAFGAWLRNARNEKKMSVPQLANASGLSAVAIYNIESGRSLNPQAETRTRLETALNRTIPDDVKNEAAEEQ